MGAFENLASGGGEVTRERFTFKAEKGNRSQSITTNTERKPGADRAGMIETLIDSFEDLK